MLNQIDGFNYFETGKVCSISSDVVGPFVEGPYVVPFDLAGKPLCLSRGILSLYSRMIGFVEEDPLLETIDQRDATIEEMQATIDDRDEQIKSLKWPAERYYAMIGNENGTDFERQISDLTAENEKIKRQLQAHNLGGRPKKQEIAA